MDVQEFRKRGREMVDFIADYMETMRNRKVSTDVSPGFLLKSSPEEVPQEGELFEDIMKDFNSIVMPGILHHQHPLFNAYFPAGHSFASILGNMLADGLGVVSTSWATSPSCTELEILVTDWLVICRRLVFLGGGGNPVTMYPGRSNRPPASKLMSLPRHFLHSSNIGGGTIQGSGSESIFLAMMAAKHRVTSKESNSETSADLPHKLVAYASSLANVCVQKTCNLGSVVLRSLSVDENYSLRGSTLLNAIESDRKLGLVPFFVCATVGTTACCSIDAVLELSEVCDKEDIWLHVDGAYAGCALVCPEFQTMISGKEVAEKGMVDKVTVRRIYLPKAQTPRQNWSIDTSRPFRALKLWFVLRNYGTRGLQQFIRKHVKLAKKLKNYVDSVPYIECVGDDSLGMVCFRIKGPNKVTSQLLRHINDSGRIHLTEATVNGHSVIRYVVCAEETQEADVEEAWNIIKFSLDEIISARG